MPYKHRKSATSTFCVFSENHTGRNLRHEYVLEMWNKVMKSVNVDNRQDDHVNNGGINVAVLGHVVLRKNILWTQIPNLQNENDS